MAMGKGCDFFNYLAPDLTSKILRCLDDPGDVVRASSVSRSWHSFIISDRTSKQLCQRFFPQLFSMSGTLKTGNSAAANPKNDGCSSSNDWRMAKMEHEMFSSLARNLLSCETGGCISCAIGASSTGRYIDEGIGNTLDRRNKIGHGGSYWSSSGQRDPNVPEKLTYRLLSSFSVVSQVDIQPFRAFFHRYHPIYSARAVRFRLGHQKVPDNATSSSNIPDTDGMQCGDDENFVWTYTSPQFPMAQESTLQSFKLPQPVLCIGGILQIELLGRAQSKELDSLFYICVAYVQVVGRSLSPVFAAEILEPCGTFSLIYNPQAQPREPQPVEAARVRTSSMGVDI